MVNESINGAYLCILPTDDATRHNLRRLVLLPFQAVRLFSHRYQNLAEFQSIASALDPLPEDVPSCGWRKQF